MTKPAPTPVTSPSTIALRLRARELAREREVDRVSVGGFCMRRSASRTSPAARASTLCDWPSSVRTASVTTRPSVESCAVLCEIGDEQRLVLLERARREQRADRTDAERAQHHVTPTSEHERADRVAPPIAVRPTTRAGSP